MTKKQQKEAAKAKRDIAALASITRSGSGFHGDKRKRESALACRGKVKW